MNNLPASRQAVYGRTSDRTWRASDFDPVQHYPAASPSAWALTQVLFVVVLFGAAGVALFYGLSS